MSTTATKRRLKDAIAKTEVKTRPIRVQLKRTKGWRMPANTVKVDRSTKFGNPFMRDIEPELIAIRAAVLGWSGDDDGQRRASLAIFKAWIFGKLKSDPQWVCNPKPPMPAKKFIEIVRAELRGKNLACWCKPGAACHADVLLEIANA